MKRSILALAGLLSLTACGSAADQNAATSGEDVAEKLESAADQSGPAAKEVLEDAADQAREQPRMAPVGQPGSFAQDAMQRAGEAEAAGAAAPSPAPSDNTNR